MAGEDRYVSKSEWTFHSNYDGQSSTDEIKRHLLEFLDRIGAGSGRRVVLTIEIFERDR